MSTMDMAVFVIGGGLDKFDAVRNLFEYLNNLIKENIEEFGELPIEFHTGNDGLFGQTKPHGFDPNEERRSKIEKGKKLIDEAEIIFQTILEQLP